jgi:tRNA dimethylallyltransferase
LQNILNVKTLYVIAGPTAVGKTAIAITLAKKLGTAIISADSRQCYKEMTIGTAKPSAAELKQVKHYFINEFSISTELTAADFEKLALGYLEEIFLTKDAAVLCGGTGLYIKALCEGLDDMPQIEPEIVTEVNKQYEQKGIEWLQDAIQNEDPLFYSKGETKNPARMLRALVFIRSNNESILNFHSGNKKERNFRIIKIGLELPRVLLYERINRRVDKMIQDGLLNEVKKLYPLKNLKNLQTVGYTELFDYLDGKYAPDEAILKIKQNTRHYAKRQLTWFRKDKEMHWFNADEDRLENKILSIK